MFNFIKRLFEKKIYFYDETLKHSDVVKKEPIHVVRLADDVYLEMYVGDSGSGKDTWATAVILVEVNGKEWRTKYDGGKINHDVEKMANECVRNIRSGWDLELWRTMARREVN